MCETVNTSANSTMWWRSKGFTSRASHTELGTERSGIGGNHTHHNTFQVTKPRATHPNAEPHTNLVLDS